MDSDTWLTIQLEPHKQLFDHFEGSQHTQSPFWTISTPQRAPEEKGQG